MTYFGEADKFKWEIVGSERVVKFLTKKRIETKLAKRIVNSVEALVNDPYPMNSRKLKGTDAYRLRIGKYRVIYDIDTDARIITIHRISTRQAAYREWIGYDSMELFHL